MTSKFRKSEKGLSEKIIVQKDPYDGRYIEVDSIELPVEGKQYFVWTRKYVGGCRFLDRGIHLSWHGEAFEDVNQKFIATGMGGNSDHTHKRYHGWRGTTEDNCVDAQSVRTCTKAARIEYQKTVHYVIEFGKDECPDKD